MSETGIEQSTTPEELQPQPINYWGFVQDERWYLPGQEKLPESVRQYLLLRKMNEGAKGEYQRKTQSQVTLAKGTGDARLTVDAAKDRHELIGLSVKGWNLLKPQPDGTLVPLQFSDKNLRDWRDQADPRLIEELEKAIRKLNPWMLADMTVEDIDREIENLQEMRRLAVEREAGEAASSSR